VILGRCLAGRIIFKTGRRLVLKVSVLLFALQTCNNVSPNLNSSSDVWEHFKVKKRENTAQCVHWKSELA